MGSQFKSRLILVILIVLSLLILALNLNQKDKGIVAYLQKTVLTVISPMQQAVNSVFTPVRNSWKALGHLSTLEENNLKLQKEIHNLKEGKIEIKEIKKENERLRSLLAFKKKIKYESLPATIIGISSSSPQSIIVIDKGKKDSIGKLMPVLAENGLVGKVIMSVNHASQVQLLTDPKSSVGATIKRTGAVGIVEGDTGGRLLLKFLPQNSNVKLNDTIVTSGLGGIFPKDILIGKISSVISNEGSGEPVIEISPAVDISKIDQIFVITNPPVELPKNLLGEQ
jgi:rod shape-determining protein MreC